MKNSEKWEKFCKANRDRQKEWDVGNEPVNILFRAIEFCGEVGELANEIKKLERSRYQIKGGIVDTENLKDEIGDVLITLFLLADSLDIDLLDVAIEKFNKTSKKYNFKTLIEQ